MVGKRDELSREMHEALVPALKSGTIDRANSNVSLVNLRLWEEELMASLVPALAAS